MWGLAAGTFLMGTTEFVIAGLLPEPFRSGLGGWQILHASVVTRVDGATLLAVGEHVDERLPFSQRSRSRHTTHKSRSVRTYLSGGTVVRMATDHFADDPRTQLERMLAGDLYIADDPQIAERQRQAMRLAAGYQSSYLDDPERARALLGELLGSMGEDVEVRPPLYVDYGSNITIGARTFVNYNLTALDVAAITIGEDCQIGPNVQLLTPTHPLEPQPRRDKLEAALPITLGDNVWLGGGVIVCPGVTIGDNSVIGAGSVVTKDIPANVVAVGSPARPVRDL